MVMHSVPSSCRWRQWLLGVLVLCHTLKGNCEQPNFLQQQVVVRSCLAYLGYTCSLCVVLAQLLVLVTANSRFLVHMPQVGNGC